MAVSALTATAAVSLFFGSLKQQVDQHDKEIVSLRAEQSSTSNTVHRLSLHTAETFQTKREGREIEARIDARLTRIEDKLDCALDLASCRR